MLTIDIIIEAYVEFLSAGNLKENATKALNQLNSFVIVRLE